MEDNFIQGDQVYNLDAITFLECMYEDFGDESINMFLVDFPYTFKGKQRVTANAWDLPVNIERFFELASKMLTSDGCICLTANQPFASYLIMKNIEMLTSKKYKNIKLANFKYEWIWEKDNGSNFVHVKHQPFKVHEQVLIFGKSPTTYNKNKKYMNYNPQFTYSKPYTMIRDGSNVTNLEGFKGRTNTKNKDGKRYPRSVQKFNLERGLHPTQKPTELFEYLIKTYTNKNDVIVDCCAGSGTTAISAMKSNRNFIINDIEFKYAELAKERINKYIKDNNLRNTYNLIS